MLQSLDMDMHTVGIDDVIHLALDTEDRRDDLQDAVQAFVDQHQGDGQTEPFSIVPLGIEDDDEVFESPIDLRVQREHRVGEDPIGIRIDGIDGIVEQHRAEGDANAVTQSLASVFADQGAHDAFIARHHAHFD